MIPNWKYWLFIVLVGAVVHLYHELFELGLWRLVPLFIIGAIYAVLFDKYRKTIVEVDK